MKTVLDNSTYIGQNGELINIVDGSAVEIENLMMHDGVTIGGIPLKNIMQWYSSFQKFETNSVEPDALGLDWDTLLKNNFIYINSLKSGSILKSFMTSVYNNEEMKIIHKDPLNFTYTKNYNFRPEYLIIMESHEFRIETLHETLDTYDANVYIVVGSTNPFQRPFRSAEIIIDF